MRNSIKLRACINAKTVQLQYIRCSKKRNLKLIIVKTVLNQNSCYLRLLYWGLYYQEFLTQNYIWKVKKKKISKQSVFLIIVVIFQEKNWIYYLVLDGICSNKAVENSVSKSGQQATYICLYFEVEISIWTDFHDNPNGLNKFEETVCV